jgi:hypothetical protein
LSLVFPGCQAWVSKEKKKENQFTKENKRFKELLEDPDRPRLVGEVASAMGMYAKNYDAFGLVTELAGTGGIVKPGPQREMMLNEMRMRDVRTPEAVLDAPYTALAKLRVYANPCDEKGEIVDVEVECSEECTATDLTGGHVLEARLRELAVLKGSLHKSDEKAVASGELVSYPASYAASPASPLKAVILGGGRLLTDHRLGLRINPELRHVYITKAIEKAINARFFFQDASKQRLVAEGKNDWFIVLDTVPKYKFDPAHFMSVILSTGFSENQDEQLERVAGCKKLLLKRETAQRGAVELEAIGTAEAKEALQLGLTSTDPEIRFYSAYSLSYLDRKEAVPVLLELARYEPAFRPLCLIGLGVNEDSLAREALEELLQESEPELRYGAYLAIRQRNPTDMAVVGEKIGQICQFVQIPSGVPQVVVSLEKKKEVLLFGSSVAVHLGSSLSPSPTLKVAPAPGGQVKLTKIQPSGDVFHAVVSSDLVSIIRSMVSIEASYNDVVHTIDHLSRQQALVTPVAMNPRPQAGRVYNRKQTSDNLDSVDTKLDIVSIDRSSLGAKEKKSFAWLSPTSWWKSTKSAPSARSTSNESSSLNSLDLSDEELDLLNN